MKRRWLAFAVAMLLALPPVAVAGDEGDWDPLEPVNRAVYSVNRYIWTYGARPAARLYEWVLPKMVRDGIRNGLDNVASPIVFANQVLQLDPTRASQTVASFGVNSLFGVGGLIDIASRLGIPRRTADFGQTLAYWGVGEGPFLFLPLLGPSTVRDTAASLAQGAVDPLNLALQGTSAAFPATTARLILGNVDLYSRRYEDLDRLEDSSLDFYAALRNVYLQDRRAEIRRITHPNETAAPEGLDYDLDLGDDF